MLLTMHSLKRLYDWTECRVFYSTPVDSGMGTPLRARAVMHHHHQQRQHQYPARLATLSLAQLDSRSDRQIVSVCRVIHAC
jgi:hypothetical protein